MKQQLLNLSKGEFGPELYGRLDMAQYSAGVKRARNFIIQKYGGLAFRPGFKFVAPADNVDTPLKYVPFDLGLDISYVLVFSELTFRVLALGGVVLEDDLQILSVTIEAQAILEVSFHEYEASDRFFISGVSGMTELNGQFATVLEVIDANHIRTDIDTRDYSAFVSSDGDDRVGAPPPPPAPPAPPPPAPPPFDPPAIGGGGGRGGDWGYNGGGPLP